jgi:hypothetical protein
MGPIEACILVEPADAATARPLMLMMAMAGTSEFHVTWLVMSPVLPFE